MSNQHLLFVFTIAAADFCLLISEEISSILLAIFIVYEVVILIQQKMK